MNEVELDKPEDLKAMRGFLSKMGVLKRQFEKENNLYESKGVGFFNKSPERYFSQIEDMDNLYQDFSKDNIFSRLSSQRIDEFKEQHDAFSKVMKEYQLNVQVSLRIADMVIEATRDTIERETKTDLGYDEKAALMSEKQMLKNMPPVRVNNRV